MNKDELLQLGFSGLYVNRDCVDCEDCLDCTHCEGCVQCMNSKGCTNCIYCIGCTDCDDCQHCIDCTGQKNKQYMVRNIQLIETEYNDFMSR